MADPRNLIERAIGALSPSWALERHKARAAMALTGGYSGGGYHERMSYWQPGVSDADGSIVRDLRELRARSRDLVRNAPIAAGAIETQVSHVVGTGLSLQSRVDAEALGLDDAAAAAWQSAVERRFAVWACSAYCDAAEQQDFYGLQDLAFRAHLESGDAFVVLAKKRRREWPFALALQVIEADRVSNPRFKHDTETMTAGIERDTGGAAVAVHIADRHPGSHTVGADVVWTRVPMRGASSGRRNVLHLMRKIRPGQSRGVPCLAPIVQTLKQLDRYSLAEVDAAVNSAAMAVFVKMDPEAFQDLYDDESRGTLVDSAKRWDGTLKAGAAVNLLPGEDITSPAPGRPNANFDPFVAAVMRQIGIGLGIPYEVLTKHFQSSYSAARAALLDAWRTFRIRRSWLASTLCQPVYEEWLADEVASGAVDAPGFFADPLVRAAWCAATWSGDGPGSIDPSKEAEAAGKRMEIGLTTLSEEIIAYDGGDWETKHRQQVRERQARDDGDLLNNTTESPEPAQPEPPSAPDVHVNVAPPSVTIGSPSINIDVQPSAAPDVRVEPPSVRVEAPVVNVSPPAVHVEAPNVTVEAVMPKPSAPVIVQQGAAERPSRIEVVRGKDGRATMTPIYDEPTD